MKLSWLFRNKRCGGNVRKQKTDSQWYKSAVLPPLMEWCYSILSWDLLSIHSQRACTLIPKTCKKQNLYKCSKVEY